MVKQMTSSGFLRRNSVTRLARSFKSGTKLNFFGVEFLGDAAEAAAAGHRDRHFAKQRLQKRRLVAGKIIAVIDDDETFRLWRTHSMLRVLHSWFWRGGD
jgi:hypothetical protein